MDTRLTRTAATSALLGAAGMLTAAAAAQRWWPACLPARFETAECLRLQDHRYEFTIPSDPWVPVGAAAELYGGGLLFLAASALLLPGLLSGRRPGWLLRIGGCVVAVALASIGVATARSGVTDAVVSVPGAQAAGVAWVLGWPALLLGAVATGEATRRTLRWRIAVCALLASVNPLAELLLAPAVMLYQSYDTTPWSEAVGAATLLAAAAGIWPATLLSPRPAPVEPGDASLGRP